MTKAISSEFLEKCFVGEAIYAKHAKGDLLFRFNRAGWFAWSARRQDWLACVNPPETVFRVF